MPATVHRLRPRVLAFPAAQRRAARAAASRPNAATNGRTALMRYLYSLSELAPDAPLSFLLVNLAPASEPTVTRALDLIETMVRPTDRADRYDVEQAGIVLQGATAERASLTAAQMSRRLMQPGVLPPGTSVDVSAATGIGRNALALPVAAASTFQDCG